MRRRKKYNRTININTGIYKKLGIRDMLLKLYCENAAASCKVLLKAKHLKVPSNRKNITKKTYFYVSDA